MKFVELIIDPSSGQLSASRLCLIVIIFVYLPVLIVLEALGKKIGIWTNIAMITSAVCGVYGVNSGARVWQQSSLSISDNMIPPILPNIPKAKLPGG